MTPAGRWRPVAVLGIVAADVLLLLLTALSLPRTAAVLAVPVALATAWALRRPGRWGASILLLLQVLLVLVSGGPPADVGGWAAAAVAAALVLSTHLALALLAAFPPGAALPASTRRRWSVQGGLLAASGAAVALLGTLATNTPASWGLALVTLAVAALATTAALVWRSTRAG